MNVLWILCVNENIMKPSFLGDFVFMSPDSLSKQYFGHPTFMPETKRKPKPTWEQRNWERNKEIKMPWAV